MNFPNMLYPQPTPQNFNWQAAQPSPNPTAYINPFQTQANVWAGFNIVPNTFPIPTPQYPPFPF